MVSLASVGASVRDVFMVAGVVWPYYPQARSILATRQPEAFSLLVSLIIIASGTLRVFFWVGKRFEAVLLVQAIAAVAAQVAMLAVVMRVKRAIGTAPAARFRDFNAATFWAWGRLSDYLEFLAAFAVAMAALTAALGDKGWFVEALGTAALGSEAMLPLPQVWRNYVSKSTAGLSRVMIGAWFAGDVAKTLIALQLNAPAQFVGCGMFQLCMDCVVLVQMLLLYPAPATAETPAAGATSGAGAVPSPSSAAAPTPADAALPGAAARWAEHALADAAAEAAKDARAEAVHHRHAHPHAATGSGGGSEGSRGGSRRSREAAGSGSGSEDDEARELLTRSPTGGAGAGGGSGASSRSRSRRRPTSRGLEDPGSPAKGAHVHI